MFCSNCGKEVKEEWVRCPYCGASLNNPGKKHQNMERRTEEDSKIPNITRPTSKKNAILLIVGAMGATIAVLIIAVLLLSLLGDNDSSESKDVKKAETIVEKQTETPTPTVKETTKTETPTPTLTNTPTPEPSKDNSYIIPDSDTRVLSVEEIAGLDANTKQMAINEIYARHGRKFDTPEIQEYFNGKAWYTGTTDATSFNEDVFNTFEKSNIDNLSAQPASNSAKQIYFAGSYSRQYNDAPLKYIELHISVGSDPGLDQASIGDWVANIELYDYEFFSDESMSPETDYDYAQVYLQGNNVYSVVFESGRVCTMNVDDTGVTISGCDIDGYYTLTERYRS